MERTPAVELLIRDQDRRIKDAVASEGKRLRKFIRRWVDDEADVQDILQDVYYELLAAERLLAPVDQIGAWLFRVARNRIVDRFRRKKAEPFPQDALIEDGETLRLEDLLPSPDAGPEAAYARSVLLDELDAALDELPDAQREVFIAHELDGISFKELSARTGVGVNTLLSRKHYAVLHLRRRLRAIHEQFR